MPTDNASGVPIVGPGSPYITPAALTAAATGISWSTIPGPKATPDQQYAEQLNICVRATAMVDEYCNQPLRATVDNEYLTGPGDFRCQNQPTGVTRLLLSRGPVTQVISGQVSAASSFPRAWSQIPANQFDPEIPLIGVYGTSAPGGSGGAGGQAVLLAPGWVMWGSGRQSFRIQVTYINGWPHGALTEPVDAADTSVHVDDITGWLGASGNIYDGGQQEFATVATVTPDVAGAISGPGMLGLAQPLTFEHERGVLFSTLPASVMQACIYYSVAQALTRGATATAVQAIGGGASGGGPPTTDSYNKLAEAQLYAYRRVI